MTKTPNGEITRLDQPEGPQEGQEVAWEARKGARTPGVGSMQVEKLFSMTDDLLAVISLEGRFTLLNPAWEQLLGWTCEELLARPMKDLIHPDDVEQTMALILAGRNRQAHFVNFTNRYRHQDGSWRWLMWNARCDGERWYASAKDVTDRMWMERQALHDPLTKLPNRLLLMDRARQALSRLHRSHGLVALLFIDLDRFKAINDNLGHAVGDDLLIAVSERLQELLRDSDTVARLGGDEFVILADELESDAEAVQVAERVLHALKEPFAIGSAEVSMLASVGVSVSHDPVADPEDLLREADVAMYRAKGAGGHGLELFDEHLRREVASRLKVESSLRHALNRHELMLAYQPLHPLRGGAPVGCEALVRWLPHNSAPVAPCEFLPLAHESKLIVEIGEWVLQSACAQAACWRREGTERAIHVNVSPRELTETDLVAKVRETLAYCELPAKILWLEIGEEAILRDATRAADTLKDLKRLGVHIALDGYGAGRSSLGLPGALPLDMLKIDRSLIMGFERDDEKRAVVMAVTALAKQKRLTTVAVGIETLRQLALAREVGCSLGQGFLLGRPESAQRLRLRQPVTVRSHSPWRTKARARIRH
jgi:diguanylate cyclase (GGDEF)-like protein/PAS domain S-box-containing protein